jgi:hypothetical protein
MIDCTNIDKYLSKNNKFLLKSDKSLSITAEVFKERKNKAGKNLVLTQVPGASDISTEVL